MAQTNDLGARPPSHSATIRRHAVVVAFVLPLRIAGWAASGLVADRRATQLRTLTAGVPVAAYVATGAAGSSLHGGIFYPLFDAGDLQNSWEPKRVSQK